MRDAEGPSPLAGEGQGEGEYDDIRRINVFDWKKEFPQIFPSPLTGEGKGGGGFDAVIGNPPYIQSRSGLLADVDKTYYMTKFKSAEYQINTYGLFIEQGINLLKTNGLLGMIIPNYWLSTDYDKKLRNLVFIDNNTMELANVYRIFANATVDTLLLFVSRPLKNSFPKKIVIKGIDRKLKTIPERLLAVSSNHWAFQQAYNIDSPTQDIKISFNESLVLRGNATLGEFFSFKFGMKPYQVGKGSPPQTEQVLAEKKFDSKEKIDASYLPLLKARNVKRYLINWHGDWIKYGTHLAEPRTLDLFTGDRLLIQRIVSADRFDGTYTNEPYICNTDVITLKPLRNNEKQHLFYFLGLLLSRPVAALVKSQNVNLDRDAFPKINTQTLSSLSVPAIDFNSPADKTIHDKMVSLVDRMLDLNKKLQSVKIAHEKELLERQIKITDTQIDQLVYELYGLTEEEVRVIEGNS